MCIRLTIMWTIFSLNYWKLKGADELPVTGRRLGAALDGVVAEGGTWSVAEWAGFDGLGCTSILFLPLPIATNLESQYS